MRRLCTAAAAVGAVLLLAESGGLQWPVGPSTRLALTAPRHWSSSGSTRLFFWDPRGEDGKKDVPDLLFFRGDHDKNSQAMLAHINQLKWEGYKIRTFEVWYETHNTELYQHLDMGRCYGHVPFFFNKRTRKYICGPTTMQNLRRWAEDKNCDVFDFPPDAVMGGPQEEVVDMNAARKWLASKRYKVQGATKERYKTMKKKLKKESPEAAKKLEEVEGKADGAAKSAKKNVKSAKEKYKETVAPVLNEKLQKIQILISEKYEELRQSSTS